MNTATIIGRYARADGTLDITSAELTHELVSAREAGREAELRRVVARHPKNARDNKLGVYTVKKS